MKLKETFITHSLGSTQIMVSSGEFTGIVRSNETAAFIIDCLKSETSKEDILGKLLSEYDVDRSIAERDVEKTLEKLREIGAIEGD